MRRRPPTSLLALLSVLVPLACWPASSAASSSPGFTPCQNPAFSCTSVPVPLDRSGAAAGTISLSVARKAASAGPSHLAVVGLAGGPGQAALPLSEFIAQSMAPALGARDLIVFDQRGTGRSDPLNCPIFSDSRALEEATAGTYGTLVERCAQQIGPARGAFTSEESVEDIEALRRAFGYEKLILYGTSYGTRVALQYAERYPQNVEALVLDSIVTANGPEPFGVPTFKAIGAVLGELCSNHACAGITSNPLGDLARLTASLRKHRLSGSAFDGSGHRHSVSLGESNLLELLAAGDLNPALRALLPAAVHSALNSDPDPLLRLYLLAEGFIPNLPTAPPGSDAEKAAKEEENNALFTATSCEEKPFPWQRSASPATRNAEALTALHALPSSSFYPFDASTGLSTSLIPTCASWPDASAPQPAPQPLPNVPTLILSGEQDLRTPTVDAEEVAAKIPDAQLLRVPYTGHSVIGSDLSNCAATALNVFFTGNVVQPCPPTSNLFAPTPIAPTKLALVHSPPGIGGNPGETLTAALDAIVDLNRQLVAATIQANQKLPSGSSFGGLRGGYARLNSSSAILKNFSFVPGVQLSGAFPVKSGTLQPATIHVSGPSASPGTIRLGATTKQVTGTLGGVRFDVSLARVKLSSVRGGSGEWPSHTVLLSPLGRTVARAPGVHTALSWLP